MPGKPAKRTFREKNRIKKEKKQRLAAAAEEEDEMEMEMMNDEHGDFFDEEFVPPEGEDLDEFDENADLDGEDLDEFDEGEGEDEEDFINQGDEEFDEADFDKLDGFGGEEDELAEEVPEYDDRDDEPEERIIIDSAKLKKVIAGVKQNSKPAFRMFLQIFRGIIIQGLSDEGMKKAKRRSIAYEVESGKVYNKIITFALTKIPHVLKKYIETVSPKLFYHSKYVI